MLKRKDGRYQDQVRLPGMDKPKYFYGKSPAEVKKKMAAFQQEAERGPLFSDVVDQWKAWHEGQISASSVKAYDKPVQDIKEYFKGRYLREIRADEIYSFLQWLAGKGLGKKSVQARKECLNMTFNYAIMHRLADANPCGAVKLPKGLHSGRGTPPADDVLRTIAEAEKKDGVLFAAILMYTGLRKGELLGLRWEDVDLQNGVIYVRRNVYYVGGSPRLKTPKTAAGEREVWIVDKLADILSKPGKGYLFGGVSPLTEAKFNKLWYSMCAQYGWTDGKFRPAVTPHQFRHAFATALFEAGVDELDAKDIMGHASISITKDIYTHIRDRRRRSTAERLNRYYEDCQDSVKTGEVVDIAGRK